MNNDTFDINAYLEKIDKIIYNILSRPTSETLSYDILETEKTKKDRLVALKVKQLQMKQGEIWQEVLGNYNGFTNLHTGHETGLDILSHTHKIAIELKSRTNTDNASSKKTNLQKLANYKKQHPDYTCIYANINDSKKITTYNANKKYITCSDVIIEHYIGYEFLKLILGCNVDIVIQFVKDTIDKYT